MLQKFSEKIGHMIFAYPIRLTNMQNFEKLEKAMDGETVIAKVNGHIYIKRYHTDPFGKWVKLISDNDPSSTIEIVGDDLQYFSIVGIIRAKVKVF